MVNSKIINLKRKYEHLAVFWYRNPDIIACKLKDILLPEKKRNGFEGSIKLAGDII